MLELLKEWQEITSGILALLAALIGATYLRRQIMQTEVLAADTQKRDLDAARLLAQFELSSLSQRISDAASDIRSILVSDSNEITSNFAGWPEQSLNALSSIQRCIDDKNRG
jgi:hypothetical protein